LLAVVLLALLRCDLRFDITEVPSFLENFESLKPKTEALFLEIDSRWPKSDASSLEISE